MSNTDKQTPLTEQQARALAHWWGGEYRQMSMVGVENSLGHGVLINRQQSDTEDFFQIFSLEEAREWKTGAGFRRPPPRTGSADNLLQPVWMTGLLPSLCEYVSQGLFCFMPGCHQSFEYDIPGRQPAKTEKA